MSVFHYSEEYFLVLFASLNTLHKVPLSFKNDGEILEATQ